MQITFPVAVRMHYLRHRIVGPDMPGVNAIFNGSFGGLSEPELLVLVEMLEHAFARERAGHGFNLDDAACREISIFTMASDYRQKYLEQFRRLGLCHFFNV